ncbi:MAG TPA: serine hydrolase [Steroidobacteraceae bacterium]|nr:serine hydrolase [Steroidobacteraceae bacterium]
MKTAASLLAIATMLAAPASWAAKEVPIGPAEVERSINPLLPGGGHAAIPLTIDKLMSLNRVSGLSVAVIHDYRLAWVKSYGVVAPGASERVTPRTLFLAGSVSKSVTAVGMMALVQQGRLSLDEDVNVKLKSWKVPENEFTRDQKVTLRRIASHTAGLTVFGFGGYAVGEPVPTVTQVLDGTPPANSPPVRVDRVPGTAYNYSGGGTTVEQLVMMDATGQTFPAVMKLAVFDRLGMRDSTFAQPLPRALEPRAASGVEADGRMLAGRWHVFPEMGAAGLWTTPTDLARLAIDVARSVHGNGGRLLDQSSAREMLTAQPATNGECGLGFYVYPQSPGAFVNNGADRGYQTMLRMNFETGEGAIIMANSENGFLVGTEYMEAIGNAYDWKVRPTKRKGGRTLVLIAKAVDIDAALAAYEDLKQAPDAGDRPNEGSLAMLGDRLFEAGDRESAIKALERNVVDYPASAAARLALGKAYAATSRNDLARDNFEKALALDPASDARTELEKLPPR